MGAFRNNMPVSFATSSDQVSPTYQGFWTNIVSCHCGDDRSGSLSLIYSRMRGGVVPNLTLGASTAAPTAQDDLLRFDGTNDLASAARDADNEGATTAGTVIWAGRLLATTTGAGQRMVYGVKNSNTEGVSIGLCCETNNTNVDLLFAISTSAGTSGNSGYNLSWNGISSPTTTDVIAVGRWATGEAPYCALYRASDGTLLDSSTGSTSSITISYNTSAGSGLLVGQNTLGTPTAWLNHDWAVGYILSRKITDQEITDIVADVFGPLRIAYTPPVLPYVYTSFKSAV